MMHARYWKTVVLALLASVPLWAQATAVSQINGTVRDAGGLAVPGAQVTVTQTATGLSRTVLTGPEGAYVIPSLPVGPYRMTVTKQGFASYVQSGIVLQVDSNPAIDAVLQVGSVTQEIAVQADASMVEAHSTGVGQVVDQERVVDLPLNGRNATQLVFVAGAATAAETGLNTNKNYPTVTISVAGGLSSSITYLLDGANHNDSFGNLNQPIPFPDALQEFMVETSALPAQYGYHAAAAVNAVTKSGGNEFHGDAFEFLRNGDLNARNFFAASRDTLKRNQYGGTLGGPIRKNKLFFFLGYQGTTQRSDPTTGIAFVPTPAMLSGNFTDITAPACNGGRQIHLNAPFVNNQISPALFSPAALNLVKHLPPTADPCGRVQFGTLSNSGENLGLARADYQLSANHTLFARYYVAHLEQASTYNNNDPLTITMPWVTDHMQFFVLGDTYLFGPNTISTFHADINRGAIQKGSPPFFDAAALGVNMTPMVPGFVVIQVTGAFNAGANAAPPGHVFTTTPQLTEDVSLVRGAHQIQFGANFIRPVDNFVINLATFGNFNFNGQITGLSMGDLLLGDLNTFQQANAGVAYDRQKYIGAYVQDSWRLSSRLTVNAGVRWEPFFATSTKYGYVSHFDPTLFAQNVHSATYPQAPAGLTFPGDPGFPGTAAYFGKMADFAPRLGVVWDPKGNGRMTVRASYGVFYDLPPSLFDYQFTLNPPWGDTVTRTRPQGGFDNPWAGFPGGNPFPTQLGKNAFFPANASYVNMPLHVQPTYLEQWNLSVQKQIGSD
ncbi:MAG TPA: TonB-dependent receptor, partial [Bryobacteraceae bacterium]|nr:TonB-dependent receptor [Bryobacteraceae bacterium]